MNKLLTIIKASGDRVPFFEEKYRESLYRSGATKDVAERVIQQIQSHRFDAAKAEAYGDWAEPGND